MSSKKRSGVEFLSIPDAGTVRWVAFDSTGRRLYAVSDNNVAFFEGGSPAPAICEVDVSNICPHPTEPLAVACSDEGAVLIRFDGPTPQISPVGPRIKKPECARVDLDSTGQLVAVSREDGTISVYSLDGERKTELRIAGASELSMMAFTADALAVVAVAEDDTGELVFHRLPLDGGTVLRKPLPKKFPDSELTRGADHFLVRALSGVALLSEQGDVLWKMKLNNENAAISADGARVAVVLDVSKETMKLFDARSGENTGTFKLKLEAAPQGVALASDRFVYSCRDAVGVVAL